LHGARRRVCNALEDASSFLFKCLYLYKNEILCLKRLTWEGCTETPPKNACDAKSPVPFTCLFPAPLFHSLQVTVFPPPHPSAANEKATHPFVQTRFSRLILKIPENPHSMYFTGRSPCRARRRSRPRRRAPRRRSCRGSWPWRRRPPWTPCPRAQGSPARTS
jgi:hypothetical protein